MYMKVYGQWYEVTAPALDEAKAQLIDPVYLAKALANPRRFDPVNKAVNAKSMGSRRKTSDEKNILAMYLQGMSPGKDKLAYDKAKIAWSRQKATMMTSFKTLTHDLASGKLTKNQFLSQSRVLFKTGYERAYRLGTDASGLSFIKLPKEDLLWLKRARQSEYKFLDKFANDITAKSGSMAYDARAAMYIDTMDSTFDAARVDAYPNDGTLIYWELAAEESCGDCIDLAINSPYTPDTLPTTPRAGGTMCLTGCKCHLRIRYQHPVDMKLQVKPVDGSEKYGLGQTALAILTLMKGGDTATAKAAALITGDDFESVQLDWDKVDDMVSALASTRILEEEAPSMEQLHEKRIVLNQFVEASRHLPEWLGPFDRELYVWHAIGTIVLEHAKEARRKEVRHEARSKE